MRPFSVREKQIITLVCEGKANKIIAHKLQLSEGTIKVYMNHIFRAIGVDNRTSLAMWAISHGFTPRWVGEYEI